jgi:hypothetical protein
LDQYHVGAKQPAPSVGIRSKLKSIMKMSKLIVIIATLLFATSVPVLVSAKEEVPAAVGSIRPTHKVKDADLPGLAKISFLDAVHAATAAVPGQIIKAELEIEDGNLMYSFEIVGTNKAITEVEIDAGNGKVLGTEIEQAGGKSSGGKKD